MVSERTLSVPRAAASPPQPTSGRTLPEAAEGADLRLVPIAAMAWIGTGLGTSGLSWTWTAFPAAAVLMIIAAARRSTLLLAVGLILVTGSGVGLLHHRAMITSEVSRLGAEEAIVSAELRTVTDAHRQDARGPRPEYVTLRATVVKITGRDATWRVRAPVLVIVSGDRVGWWMAQPVGTLVRVTAHLQQPTPGSDFAAVARIRSRATVVKHPTAGLRAVEAVRSGLRESVAGRSPEQRALVPALVLGDTSAMTPEIKADFQDTGLTHLTAVSGANLTLLLAFMVLIARWCGVRGWWLRLVGLIGVIIFVALCRTEPSVLRAAAMGLVALAALGSGGVHKGLRNLSVAMVILLLADPWLSRSVGFALSVLASAGIVWWAGRWARVMSTWLPRIVAESVAVPLAAHLATLPVVAAISDRVSVVGVITNAVAGPFVGPATVLGFAAAGLSLISGLLAAIAGFGAAWASQCILWTAHLGARFPGAAWSWPTSPAGLTVLGGLSLALALLMPRILSHRWVALAVALVMIVGFARPPVQPGWPPKDWVLVACDVGQGDGLVLRVDDRQAVVVDTGPDPPALGRCLDQLDIRAVPLVVLTHYHADHVAGLPAVIAGRQVGEMWVSPVPSPEAEARGVAELAAARAIPVRIPAVGESLLVGNARLTVLGPAGSSSAPGLVGDGENSAENDASLVIRAVVDGVRVLLTGDVEPAGQQAIMRAGTDVSANVLKLPHHGSARQDPDFFAATGASVAIASAGLDNEYGHPAPRTVGLAESLGMTVLRTDQQGGIAVTRRDRGLSAVTQR